MELAGKRVGVVGIGATGIQVIQTIASQVGQLKVFVRTPQYVLPMKNPSYGPEDVAAYKARFEELKSTLPNTFTGFEYDFQYAWADLTPAQRLAVLEDVYANGSLKLWLASFGEMFFDEAVSEEVSAFVRKKMRARLEDPRLCELLIPSDYGFGTHRVPLESNYLEAYHRPNVEAVSVKNNPIARVTPEGIELADGTLYELDVIILATGFDAGTGALTRIDIRGRGGRSLKEDWGRDIRTMMGLQVHGYPNLFTTAVPLAPSAALCNMTTCLQQQTEWISDCIRAMRAKGKTIIEPTKAAEDAWVAHHDETANATLISKTTSWYLGSNVPGKAAARAVVYRRRRHLPTEVQRGCGRRLRRLRHAMSPQQPPGDKPMTSNFTSAADGILQGVVASTPRVPGVVAMVTNRERNLYEGAAGVRRLGADPAMATDSVFALFSTTKAITATAALQLIEAGQLDLAAPARDYAPDIGRLQVIEGFDDDGEPRLRAPKRQITTKDLLTHTAGFGYDFFNATYARLAEKKGQPSVITASKAALMTPLLFDPGEKWEYGSNLDWAGQVVEGITGKRLGEVFQSRIFEPLGMQRHDLCAERQPAPTPGRHACAQCGWLLVGDGLRAALATRRAHGRPRPVRHGGRLHALHPHVAQRRPRRARPGAAARDRAHGRAQPPGRPEGDDAAGGDPVTVQRRRVLPRPVQVLVAAVHDQR